MIKELQFRGKTIKGFYIDSETSIVTDENGVERVQHCPSGKRPYVCIGTSTSYPIHQLMGHTFLGYFKGCIVHHKDCNPLNNELSNLMLMTRKEHIKWHSEHRTDEWRERNRASQIGVPKTKEHVEALRKARIGKKYWINAKGEIVFVRECPGEGWERCGRNGKPLSKYYLKYEMDAQRSMQNL